MVSPNQRKRIQEKSLKKRRAKAVAKKSAPVVTADDATKVAATPFSLRTVTYKDEPLNELHDELQGLLGRVTEVSKQLDKDDLETNLAAALIVGFSGLAAYAGDNGISLFDFLRLIEQEANVMIQEVRAIHANGNDTVN